MHHRLVPAAAFITRRWRLLLGTGALVAVLLQAALVWRVQTATSPYIYNQAQNTPPEPVAIVFGAGLTRNGQPSRVLADRVRAAAALYQAGRVERLLMTGDNSTLDYNEVAAMQRYAQQLGVPAAAITLDYAGFRTYESCYRARVIFGVQRAVLVTQRYHLPRALYTCQSMGIASVGLGTPDWGRLPQMAMLRYSLREHAATLVALWQVHITRPRPTFLGPFEGLS